jgi:Flp pilus assembly protein CpaB
VGARLREALGWLTGPGRRRQWRRAVVRRLLAAGCAVAAALGVVSLARSDARPPTVPVVVATRPLAVGELATPGALRLVQWPAELAPEGALRAVSEAVGRRLAIPVQRGDALTRPRLRAGSLLAGQPPDQVAIRVGMADPGATSMVQAGDVVDLLASWGVVASGVRVLRVDAPVRTDFGSVLEGPGSSSGYAVDGWGLVVAARPESARSIARALHDPLGGTSLAVVLRSR